MLARKQQPLRPHSRLQNIYYDCTKENIKRIIGIPEKLISSSKPFPYYQIQDDDKENNLLNAPKKKQKNQSIVLNKNHDIIRRIQSGITRTSQMCQNRSKIFWLSNQNKKNKFPVEHLLILQDCVSPFSKLLINNQQCMNSHQRGNKEQKSFAKRARQMIQAQKGKKQQYKSKKKLGQEAYLPFTLKQLCNKIVEKSVKNSQECAVILLL